MEFLIRDKVDGYYLIYDGTCGITHDKHKATVFKLYIKNGQLRMSPEVPEPFMTDSEHAWEPIAG